MASYTLSQSLDLTLALPVCQQRDNDSPDTKASGASTEACEEPKFGVLKPYDKTYLSTTNRVLVPSVLQLLGRHHLGAWETTRALYSEGDVVDASAVQLINPINMALNAIFPNTIFCMSENTSGHQSLARADKVWKRKLVDKKGRVLLPSFAILDYKKPGMIREREIKRATMSQQEADKLLKSKKMPQPQFDENAEVILKQAVNYFRSYKTRYIAFFDWDSLFLVILSDAEDKYGGNSCQVSLIKDRKHMRRALLGFLCEAYQAHTRS